MDKTTYVIVDENMLCYLHPSVPHLAGVLAASILRGAKHAWKDGPIAVPAAPRMRPATRQDFADFRVCADGYDLNS